MKMDNTLTKDGLLMGTKVNSGIKTRAAPCDDPSASMEDPKQQKRNSRVVSD